MLIKHKSHKTELNPWKIVVKTLHHSSQRNILNRCSSTRSKMNGRCYVLWCLSIINEARFLNDNSSKLILYCLRQKSDLSENIQTFPRNCRIFCNTRIRVLQDNYCDYWQCTAGTKIWIIMQQKSLTNF